MLFLYLWVFFEHHFKKKLHQVIWFCTNCFYNLLHKNGCANRRLERKKSERQKAEEKENPHTYSYENFQVLPATEVKKRPHKTPTKPTINLWHIWSTEINILAAISRISSNLLAKLRNKLLPCICIAFAWKIFSFLSSFSVGILQFFFFNIL